MNRENVRTSSILKNLKAVRIMECAFPGFDDERIGLFADALKGYDAELVKYVIEQWVLTKEKPPTIAELVDNCKLIDGWIAIQGKDWYPEDSVNGRMDISNQKKCGCECNPPREAIDFRA